MTPQRRNVIDLLIKAWQQAADTPEFRHGKALASVLAEVMDELDTNAAEAREHAHNLRHSGVDYCVAHHGIRNEDEYPVCDFADDDTSRECVLVELTYDPQQAKSLPTRG